MITFNIFSSSRCIALFQTYSKTQTQKELKLLRISLREEEELVCGLSVSAFIIIKQIAGFLWFPLPTIT